MVAKRTRQLFLHGLILYAARVRGREGGRGVGEEREGTRVRECAPNIDNMEKLCADTALMSGGVGVAICRGSLADAGRWRCWRGDR